MRDADLIERFQRRMLELGCPGKKVRRAAQELADHYEDLKQAAVEEGLSDAASEERAASLLGEPTALAERAAAALRHSSWWGRHPLLGFGLLAPLGFALAWMLSILVVGVISWLVELAFGPPAEQWLNSTMTRIGSSKGSLLLAQTAMNATLIGLFAVFVCWLARRSAAGVRWAIIACVGCALHGWFFRITLSAHWMSIGYYWKPNWVCFITPLLVAGAFLVADQQRGTRLLPALSALALFAVIFSGCTTHQREKPLSQRGWIGGDYKTARNANFFNTVAPNPSVALCLPRELAASRKSAIVVTGMQTNAPAAMAGLLKNDFILELDHRPVRSLQQFRRLIDHSSPGEAIDVKACRDGQTIDLQVVVGKEMFRKGGVVSIAFPSVVHGWDLWFNPGLSCVIAGYEPNPGLRHQLGEAKEVYVEDWKAFAAIFEVSGGKRIVSQTAAAKN
jgi:hypothetical protein